MPRRDPNNPDIYNAAFAGALGGMFAKQTVAITNQAYYDIICLDASTFALDFDSRIAHMESVPTKNCDLIRKLCEAWWRFRNPISLDQALAGAVEAFYDPVANPIFAAYSDAVVFLA